jgi:1,4-dihydroxy-2-naphthoate polyprenyltransferase
MIKAWLGAMRLRTLPLALSTVFMGNAVVWNKLEEPYLILTLALATTILLQILSNFANDYGDYKNGADNEQRLGPKRAVQSGAISAPQMKSAIAFTVVLCLAAGIALIYIALWQRQAYTSAYLMFGLGITGILAAYFYTAGARPYGYVGLGDLAVLLFFGGLGVGGNAFIQSLHWQGTYLFPALAIGALSAGVLNLNNMRDHENDRSAGKNTLVVQWGLRNAKIYHSILMFIAWICLIITIQLFHFRSVAWAILPILVFQCFKWLKTCKMEKPAQFDQELKPLALTTAIISFWLFLIA